jgi:hypothetical protein
VIGAELAFAARLAALARMPDPEDRRAVRLLAAVVQDWALLSAYPAPTFELEGNTLRVGPTVVALPPPLRNALGSLEGALRAHGAAGVRLVGPVDRGAVLAFLRGARALPASAPFEELQRWVSGHGGASLQLLPARPPLARDPRAGLLPTLTAWGALTAAMEEATEEREPPLPVQRALRALIDEAKADPRALPTLLPFVATGTERRAASLVLLALALGVRLGLERQALADLGLAALDLAGLPEESDPAGSARAIGRRLGPTLGLTAARRLQAFGGLRVLADRPAGRHPHLFTRILALCAELEQLTRPGGAHRVLPDEAVARLQGQAGRRHDPLLVQVLIGVIGRYPVGSVVVLDTGEVGVVCRPPAASDQAARPVVRVVVDRAGTVLGGGPVLDLAQAPRARTRIIATVDPARLGIAVAPAVFG